MSSMMLDDENQMGRVNPFVNNPPGRWGAPIAFSNERVTPIKEIPQWDAGDSPACTAGLDTICLYDTPDSLCPLNRQVEPHFHHQPDLFTGYIDRLLGNNVVPRDGGYWVFAVIIVILAIVTWALLKR